MAYAVVNFKTKKALKEAVEISNTHSAQDKKVRVYQPGLGHDLSNYTGSICLEGPHYPAAHTWCCQAEMINGVIVKVK